MTLTIPKENTVVGDIKTIIGRIIIPRANLGKVNSKRDDKNHVLIRQILDRKPVRRNALYVENPVVGLQTTLPVTVRDGLSRKMQRY